MTRQVLPNNRPGAIFLVTAVPAFAAPQSMRTDIQFRPPKTIV